MSDLPTGKSRPNRNEYGMTMKTTVFVLATILVHAAGLPGQEQQAFDFPNHHLHNFGVNERTYEHAMAMGYRLVPAGGHVDRDRKPEYRRQFHGAV